jgi:DNA-directed RNA polymerase specialized sigma24 family protein
VGVEVEQVAKLALATEDEDPRAALEAATELRSAASGLEAAVVRRARIAGWSWAEIAVVLGVSKQAVHRKYGRS